MFEFYYIVFVAIISSVIVYGMVEKKRQGDDDEAFVATSIQYGIFSSLIAIAISFILLQILYVINPAPEVTTGIAISYGVIALITMALTVHYTPFHKNIRLINEKIFRGFLFACASFAFFVTVGIVMSLLTETLHFFKLYSFFDFMTGLEWSPQVAIRADQAGSSGKFGSIPLLVGTLLITTIALCVAFPIGIGAAVYLSEFASDKGRRIIKPILEILAGVPTVVYGFFAAVTVAPFLKSIGSFYGIDVSSESALAAGLVMGVMIIPYICSLSDDVLHAVPQSLRDGSMALGSTHTETILRVTLPAAFPGIVSAFVLGFSRAIGETMIVLMAAGLAGNLTLNPLDSVTTFTVQIGTLLTGDQEFNSVKTLSAFALGSALFLTTLVLNLIAVRTIRKYREKYAS